MCRCGHYRTWFTGGLESATLQLDSILQVFFNLNDPITLPCMFLATSDERACVPEVSKLPSKLTYELPIQQHPV